LKDRRGFNPSAFKLETGGEVPCFSAERATWPSDAEGREIEIEADELDAMRPATAMA
jgi:hypothetical protein